MGWPDERRKFEKTKNDITTYLNSSYDKDVADFNKYAGAFVVSAGMNGSAVPMTENGKQLDADAILLKLYQSYTRIKANYKATTNLKDDIANYLIGSSSTSDVQGKLRAIGTLQQELANLEDMSKRAETEDTAAKDRQDAIQKRNEKVSFPQMFSGINKPLEQKTYQWLLPVGLALFALGAFLMWPGVKSIYTLPATVAAGLGSIDLPFYKKPAFVWTMLGLMGASVVATLLVAFGVIQS